MKGLMRLLYRLAMGLLMAVLCTPAHALDPLTLFLLRVLRDKIISTGIEASVERATAAAPVSRRLPHNPACHWAWMIPSCGI